jgi:predicted RNase H-like HicB family nuclease
MKSATTQNDPTRIETSRRTRHFFYNCPALDLWSVGTTREEAEEKLKEEIALLLTRCSEYGGTTDPLIGGYATIELRPA